MYVDRSGTISTAGKAQVVASRNPPRQMLFVQNQSADTFYVEVSDDREAVQGVPSIKLAPGETLTMEAPAPVDPSRVTIIGPNAGAAFVVREA